MVGSIFFCRGMDSYWAEVERRGANIETPPKEYPYGMRDFAVRDLDGNRLSFGEETSAHADGQVGQACSMLRLVCYTSRLPRQHRPGT